jgi:hypothetical protein
MKRQDILLQVTVEEGHGSPHTWDWEELTGISDRGEIKVMWSSGTRDFGPPPSVHLDTDTSDEPIVLFYEYLQATSNDWETPVVTRQQFTGFVTALYLNDRNGTWGKVFVDDEGTLCHVPNDADPEDADQWDVFPQVATKPDGTPLYAIPWTLVKTEQEENR